MRCGGGSGSAERLAGSPAQHPPGPYLSALLLTLYTLPLIAISVGLPQSKPLYAPSERRDMSPRLNFSGSGAGCFPLLSSLISCSVMSPIITPRSTASRSMVHSFTHSAPNITRSGGAGAVRGRFNACANVIQAPPGRGQENGCQERQFGAPHRNLGLGYTPGSCHHMKRAMLPSPQAKGLRMKMCQVARSRAR